MNALPTAVRHLLLVGVATLTAVALSYGYVQSVGSSSAFVAVVGAGLLLAALVAVPVWLFGGDRDSG